MSVRLLDPDRGQKHDCGQYPETARHACKGFAVGIRNDCKKKDEILSALDA